MYKFIFFISCVFFLFLGSAHANNCASAYYDETAQVEQVIDGDTVRLLDGRDIRLIGIDTPEINHQETKKSAAYALAAKAKLVDIIGPSKQLKLVYDHDFIDPYDRLLAHTFNHNNENIQASLLKAGLARHWLIGENQKYWSCYKQHEIKARVAALNLWHKGQTYTLKTEQVRQQANQFVEIKGKITRIWQDSNMTTWVVLDRYLYIGIKQNQWQKFKHFKLTKQRQGESFIVRGRPYYHKKHWRIQLNHPWQLITQNELTLN